MSESFGPSWRIGNMLQDIKLTFAQKAALAKAMCWSQHESDVWGLIFAINSLRNELANQLESPRVEDKTQEGLSICFLLRWRIRKAQGNMLQSADQANSRAVICMGLPGNYEGEAKYYRSMNDRFAAMRDSFAKAHAGSQ